MRQLRFTSVASQMSRSSSGVAAKFRSLNGNAICAYRKRATNFQLLAVVQCPRHQQLIAIAVYFVALCAVLYVKTVSFILFACSATAITIHVLVGRLFSTILTVSAVYAWRNVFA